MWSLLYTAVVVLTLTRRDTLVRGQAPIFRSGRVPRGKTIKRT